MKISTRKSISCEDAILLYRCYYTDLNLFLIELFKKISNEYRKVYRFRGITRSKILYETVDGLELKEISTDPYDPNNIPEGWSEKVFSQFFDIIFEYYYVTRSLCKYSSNMDFHLRIETAPEKSNSVHNDYSEIIVTNCRKGDRKTRYQYYFEKRQLYQVTEIGNHELLSNAEKKRVLDSVPSFEWNDLPQPLQKYIEKNRYSVDVDSKLSASFEDKEDCISQIKASLLELKRLNYDPSQMPYKIRISNSLFFSVIDEDRKTINPFFRDKDIIKYCDLSEIDFENADLRNAYLPYTNANIDITKVFNRDISNSDLEGIRLIGQDLKGIKADGANLIGTHVTVSIGDTSIIGARFDTNCDFFMGQNKLDAQGARAMGLDIIEVNNNQLPNLRV